MDNSHLRKLAPELRHRIYELVLAQDEPVYIIQTSRAYGKYKQDPDRSRPLHAAITQTCRLLRQETTKMFYGRQTFVFGPPTKSQLSTPLTVGLGFLESIGDTNASSVRNVRLIGHQDAYIQPDEFFLKVLENQLEAAVVGADRICQVAPDCTVMTGIQIKWRSRGSPRFDPLNRSATLRFHLHKRLDIVQQGLFDLLKQLAELVNDCGPDYIVSNWQDHLDIEWRARQRWLAGPNRTKESYRSMCREELLATSTDLLKALHV